MPKKAAAVLSSALFVALASPYSATAQIRPGYPGPYPYRYAGAESNLRLTITPKQATVYVDGYFAGHVDDYDGVFQRLHVQPGPHEILVYLKGYHGLREKLYLSPNATRKISGKLEPLAAGEPDEPLPTPLSPPLPPAGGVPAEPDRPTYNPT